MLTYLTHDMETSVGPGNSEYVCLLAFYTSEVSGIIATQAKGQQRVIGSDRPGSRMILAASTKQSKALS